MRIIKKGIKPEEKIHRVTCHHCKTEFEFSVAEGKITYDQRDGDSVSISCPNCSVTCYSLIKDGKEYIPSSKDYYEK